MIMEKLTKNDRIKIEILKQFKKKNISYTASILSEIIECKFETIKKALDFFVLLGIIDKDVKEHGSKYYTYYDITEFGEKVVEKIE